MIPHNLHKQKTSIGTAMATMCPFPSDEHDLTHWRYLFLCCVSQDPNKDDTNTCKTMCFNMYIYWYITLKCMTGIHMKKKTCALCSIVLTKEINKTLL